MKIEKAVETIVMVTILVGVLLGGMDFAKFGVTLLAVTTAYLVLGMFMPGIPWVVFLDPWECAAVVLLGRPAGVEGPGGPVLLIPFAMWIREIVDLRDQSQPLGPFQGTTKDLVEIQGLQGELVHRIRRTPSGRVLREDVEAWAFGTNPSARETLLRGLPVALIRRRAGSVSLKELLAGEVQVGTTEINELASRAGREVRGLLLEEIDLPDTFRDAMSRQATHTAEAAGLDAIRGVLATAQGEGVADVLSEVRRSLALTEIESPIVIAGDRGRGNEVANLIAALSRSLELGGRRGGRRQ